MEVFALLYMREINKILFDYEIKLFKAGRTPRLGIKIIHK